MWRGLGLLCIFVFAGVEVRAPNPVLATQSNEDGKFVSIDLCVVSW